MCSQLSQVWPTGSRFLEAWITLIYEIVVLMLSSAITFFCYSCSMDQLWRGTQDLKSRKLLRLSWQPLWFSSSVGRCTTSHSGNISFWHKQQSLFSHNIWFCMPSWVWNSGIRSWPLQVTVLWSVCQNLQSSLDIKQILSSLQNGHEWTRSQKYQHIHCMFVYFLCYITWKKKWLLCCFLYVTLHLLC